MLEIKHKEAELEYLKLKYPKLTETEILSFRRLAQGMVFNTVTKICLCSNLEEIYEQMTQNPKIITIGLELQEKQNGLLDWKELISYRSICLQNHENFYSFLLERMRRFVVRFNNQEAFITTKNAQNGAIERLIQSGCGLVDPKLRTRDKVQLVRQNSEKVLMEEHGTILKASTWKPEEELWKIAEPFFEPVKQSEKTDKKLQDMVISNMRFLLKFCGEAYTTLGEIFGFFWLFKLNNFGPGFKTESLREKFDESVAEHLRGLFNIEASKFHPFRTKYTIAFKSLKTRIFEETERRLKQIELTSAKLAKNIAIISSKVEELDLKSGGSYQAIEFIIYDFQNFKKVFEHYNNNKSLKKDMMKSVNGTEYGGSTLSIFLEEEFETLVTKKRSLNKQVVERIKKLSQKIAEILVKKILEPKSFDTYQTENEGIEEDITISLDARIDILIALLLILPKDPRLGFEKTDNSDTHHKRYLSKLSSVFKSCLGVIINFKTKSLVFLSQDQRESEAGSNSETHSEPPDPREDFTEDHKHRINEAFDLVQTYHSRLKNRETVEKMKNILEKKIHKIFFSGTTFEIEKNIRLILSFYERLTNLAENIDYLYSSDQDEPHFLTGTNQLSMRGVMVELTRFLWPMNETVRASHILSALENMKLTKSLEKVKSELGYEIKDYAGIEEGFARSLMDTGITNSRSIKYKPQGIENENFINSSTSNLQKFSGINSKSKQNSTKRLIINFVFVSFDDAGINSKLQKFEQFEESEANLLINWDISAEVIKPLILRSSPKNPLLSLQVVGSAFQKQKTVEHLRTAYHPKKQSFLWESLSSHEPKAEKNNFLEEGEYEKSVERLFQRSQHLEKDSSGTYRSSSLSMSFSDVKNQKFVDAGFDPMTDKFYRAIQVGRSYASLLSTTNFLYKKPINLIGHSLGSLTALHTAYDLSFYGQHNRIGDVCLMGSVITHQELYDKLPRLIGSEGSVNGRIFVLYHENDEVLGQALLGAMDDQTIGRDPLSYFYMASCFSYVEGYLDNKMDEKCLLNYLKSKIININIKDLKVFEKMKTARTLQCQDSFSDYIDTILDEIGFGSFSKFQ